MHKENSGEGRSGIEIFMKRRARGLGVDGVL